MILQNCLTPVDGTPDVLGWACFTEFYDRIVDEAPDDSIIVEVGVFCGKSLIHLANVAKASGKKLRLYGVDSFHGSPEINSMILGENMTFGDLHPATSLNTCFTNLLRHGVLDDVTLIVSDSVKASDLFKPQDIFAVMLDGAHDYQSVMNDIQAWGTKVQRGGYLAGDDYHVFSGVKDAVHDSFEASEIMVPGAWWEVKY